MAATFFCRLRHNEHVSNERKGMTPQQKQMLVAVILGLIMGLIIAWLAGFWMWIPAGIAVGLATGAIMKPPSD